MEHVKIRLSDQFRALALECEQEVLTMRELITALGIRGHGFIALLFSIPFILPIPLPGLSMVFGLFVFVSGLGVTFGFGLWLPNWWMRRTLPGYFLSRVFRTAAKLMQKIEKILRPRLFFLSDSVWMRAACGLLIALAGFILALPLPPGTNFPPAIVSVLLALGILERDGLFLIAGIGAFVINLSVIVGLLIYARPWLLSFF